MPPWKQREIASKGGVTAHRKGVAHEWTPAEAQAAGRKGGSLSRPRRLPVGFAKTSPGGLKQAE